jgi:hypothetical protein
MRQVLADWAKEHEKALYDTIPPAPKGLRGRDRDIWEPLFGVCDTLAEADWSDRIRNLSLRLDKAVVKSESTGVRLLAALKAAFDSSKSGQGAVSSLLSEEILALPGVLSLANGPVPLASLLRPFNIRSQKIRRGEKVKKGYLMSEFLPAFEAHADSIGLLLEHPEHGAAAWRAEGAATTLQALQFLQRP